MLKSIQFSHEELRNLKKLENYKGIVIMKKSTLLDIEKVHR